MPCPDLPYVLSASNRNTLGSQLMSSLFGRGYEISAVLSRFQARSARLAGLYFAFRPFCEIEATTLRLVTRMLGLGHPGRG